MQAVLLLSVSIVCPSTCLNPTSDVSLEMNTSTTALCEENCLEFTITSISDEQDLNYSDQSASLTNFTVGNNSTPTIKCLPGQSAYTENDLKVIIEEILYKSHTFRIITDNYYKTALILRNEYEQCLNDLEKYLTNQPLHLKHIMEEILQMRERVQRLSKQISTKLNEYDSYEKIFNDTSIKVNDFNANFENTLKICQFNCQHKVVNKEAVMRSRRFFEDSVYCSTYGELVKIIKDRLNLFQTELIAEMADNIKIDSNVLNDKITMIKNKLKEAGLNYFGITSYEILSLQDNYYHLWDHLQKFNSTKYFDEIEINYYKMKSHLVELEGLEIRAREYCNHCNDEDFQINGNLIAWTAEFPSKLPSRRLLNRNYQPEIGLGTTTILDRVLNDITVKIKGKFNEDYIFIFKDLKEKLDNTKIIKRYFMKLKPLHDDVANEVKNEIKAFKDIQGLVPNATRDKVANLLRISEVMLEFIKHEIIRIKKFLNIN